MDEPDFRAGKLSIRYLEDHPDILNGDHDEKVLQAAAVTAALLEEAQRGTLRVDASSNRGGKEFSAWRQAGFPFRGRR